MLTGALAVALLGLLALALLGRGGTTPAPSAQGTGNGNMTLTLDGDALNLYLRQALARNASDLPFPLSNVTATLRQGDEIDVAGDAQILGGSRPISMKVIPTVTSDGKLHFQVNSVVVSGYNVSLGGAVNRAIENALDRQFADFTQGSFNGLSYQVTQVSTTPDALIVRFRLSGGSAS